MQLFNTFDLVLVLTRGGPGTASRTLGYTLYQQGLVDFNIGLASATTWVIVVLVNALIALYVFFVFKDWHGTSWSNRRHASWPSPALRGFESRSSPGMQPESPGLSGLAAGRVSARSFTP